MERNENGLPDYDISCRDREKTKNMQNGNGVTKSEDMNCSEEQLAMVYSPYQCFRMLYPTDKALSRGTLFEELDKPLEVCKNG